MNGWWLIVVGIGLIGFCVYQFMIQPTGTATSSEPKPPASKFILYGLGAALWGVAAYLFYNGWDSTHPGSYYLFSIILFITGIVVLFSARHADAKLAADMGERATAREQHVRHSRATVDLGNVMGEAQLASALRIAQTYAGIARYETETKESMIRGNLTLDAAGQNLTVDKYLNVQEKKLLDKADLDKEFAQMQERVRMAIVAKHYTDHQVIDRLSQALDELYLQIEDIKARPIPEGAKQRMIEDREEYVATLKEDRRGRQKRLLEAHNGGDVRGDDEDTDI